MIHALGNAILDYGQGQQLHLIFPILISVICGLLVGMYRSHKASGVRTFLLVTVGSTLFTLVSIHGFAGKNFGTVLDTSRLAAQIVSGVGFIGAGLIWKADDGLRGLTTAAGVWASAAIGVMVGVGWHLLAMLTTLLIVFIFELKSITEKVFTQ